MLLGAATPAEPINAARSARPVGAACLAQPARRSPPGIARL